jgi:nuclear pore complex protein Nup85
MFTYANFLHSDPGLWRITVAYLYSCGNVGRKTGDEILMRVPLRLHKKEKELEEKFRAGEVVGVMKAINESCLEHKRETVRRAVCRVGSVPPKLRSFRSIHSSQIAARTFTDEKAYDLAMEFCNSAEDWVGLRRVVDRVLNEYVANGACLKLGQRRRNFTSRSQGRRASYVMPLR